MDGRCWSQFSAPRSVLICSFGRASEEVEEEKAAGQSTLAKRRGATATDLRQRRMDVGVGTFFSNVVMFFIILTTAITLNRHGITHIETSRQAAPGENSQHLSLLYLWLEIGHFVQRALCIGHSGAFAECKSQAETVHSRSGHRLRRVPPTRSEQRPPGHLSGCRVAQIALDLLIATAVLRGCIRRSSLKDEKEQRSGFKRHVSADLAVDRRVDAGPPTLFNHRVQVVVGRGARI